MLIKQQKRCRRGPAFSAEVRHQILSPGKLPNGTLYSQHVLLFWAPYRPLSTASRLSISIESLLSCHSRNFGHQICPSWVLTRSVSNGVVVSRLKYRVSRRPFPLKVDFYRPNPRVEKISSTKVTYVDPTNLNIQKRLVFHLRYLRHHLLLSLQNLLSILHLLLAARMLLFKIRNIMPEQDISPCAAGASTLSIILIASFSSLPESTSCAQLD